MKDLWQMQAISGYIEGFHLARSWVDCGSCWEGARPGMFIFPVQRGRVLIYFEAQIGPALQSNSYINLGD